MRKLLVYISVTAMVASLIAMIVSGVFVQIQKNKEVTPTEITEISEYLEELEKNNESVQSEHEEGKLNSEFAALAFRQTTYGNYENIFTIYFLSTACGAVVGALGYLIFEKKKKLKELIIPFVIGAAIIVLVVYFTLELSSDPWAKEMVAAIFIAYAITLAVMYCINIGIQKSRASKLNKELNSTK